MPESRKPCASETQLQRARALSPARHINMKHARVEGPRGNAKPLKASLSPVGLAVCADNTRGDAQSASAPISPDMQPGSISLSLFPVRAAATAAKPALAEPIFFCFTD
jgi:hypothetical protein